MRIFTLLTAIAAVALLGSPAHAQDDILPTEMCVNTCNWAGDGECDDGGALYLRSHPDASMAKSSPAV